VQIVQFVDESATPRLRVGRIERDQVVDLTNPGRGLDTTLDLIAWADRERASLAAAVEALAGHGRGYPLASLEVAPNASSAFLEIPLHPPEVWGCGVTYRKSAEFRDEETNQKRGMYDQVYAAARPEIFFKGTAARCVGPRGPIGIRSDSTFTAPEPELAIVVGSRGGILAYTVADDVSAWDIERENPLYLPQSKIFQGCCALGPALVTPEEVPDPYGLSVAARILRAGTVTFEDRVETSRIKRRLEELIEYLCRDNPIPAGTVVLTGTGIIVSAEHALRDGDIVEVEIPGFGRLLNPARRLG